MGHPAIHDAILRLMGVQRLPGDGPVVVFHYGLVGADSESIERRVSRVYFWSDSHDYNDLAVDLRRLGFETPFDFDDLDRISFEIEHGQFYVEVMVGDPAVSEGEGDVRLVRRHW